MLSKLVDDIVAVPDDREAQELKREPLSLAQLVRTSLADFRAHRRKGLRLTLSAEIAPGVPPVPGDVLTLRRALDNLVINALKFTSARGPCDRALVWKPRHRDAASFRHGRWHSERPVGTHL